MATKAEILLEANERITAILESPEGLRNGKAARELALHSTMDARAAIAMLAKLPAENPFADAMSREGPVGVTGMIPGAGSGGGTGYTAKAENREERLAQIQSALKGFNQHKGYARNGGGR